MEKFLQLLGFSYFFLSFVMIIWPIIFRYHCMSNFPHFPMDIEVIISTLILFYFLELFSFSLASHQKKDLLSIMLFRGRRRF